MPRPVGMRRDDSARAFVQTAAIVFGAVVTAALLFIATAPAKAETECATLTDLQSIASEKYPGVETVSLAGDQAADFMTLFNATPPPSNYVATEVFIVFHEHFARVVLFRNGCGYGLPPVRTKFVRMWLKEVLGTSV